ncbi:hypothetical protein [Archangium primigenium]|uniref:hypothetical protein n=1 Tax=[Archangium] primigenium TaxID=2792470 RepID=UPI00195B3728|nr:hypothetical protein [Archangium primigenium]MBM7119075.1 hypothetical protein [Archangium primigenium]
MISRTSWRGWRALVLAGVLGLGSGGCGDPRASLPLEHPTPTPFEPMQVRAQANVAAVPGFADQTGGGVFVTAMGQAIRVRLDGSLASLGNHPGNPVVPGKVHAVFRMGTGSALVETETGLFLSQGSWLISPPWRDALSPGLKATAATLDGAVWLAHASGLYRLRDGQLAALKVSGAALDGISAMVAAPTDGGGSALWVVRQGELRVVLQTAVNVWQVRPVALPLDSDERVVDLVGLGASEMGPAELWVLTSQRLLRRAADGWRGVSLMQRPTQVLASGRFLWVKAGDTLLSHDADAGTWGVVSGLDTREFHFLAADESGCAWVQLGAETVAISRGPVPRVLGLYEGMTLVDDNLVVSARPAPGEAPLSFAFELGGVRVPSSGPTYYMGGVEADGTPRPYSFVGLTPGRQTLSAVALYANGTESRRSVSFDFQPVSTQPVSWEADIRPIHQARCAKCHELKGPGLDLSTYALWKTNKERILTQVRQQLMPADGPMDPQLITLIQRWAATGANP